MRSHLRDASHVLPALARHAQAGDRYALLLAAVFMRDLLRAIAQRAGGDIDERTEDALALTFALLRAAAEPDTLTEAVIAAQLSKRLQLRHSGPDAAVPVDPHAPVFDQPIPEPDQHRHTALHLLADARAHQIITALEYQTLHALYLRTGTFDPRATARALAATTETIQQRSRRAIRKLAEHYASPHRHRAAA
ncbi:hypothetical protein [Mycobacterium syngnathidarum]|uniref:hypothetical protein n=1 Tax=Mycobacterium syngnathidarum TaxID=1908205 RepID=UPI0009F9B0A6|nr:hypothetical protein [Mycobacterium syngnathidarum]